LAKKLVMEFEKGGVVTADFLEDKAPVTCKEIINSLPLTVELIHAMWAGEEVFHKGIPTENDLPLENPQRFFEDGGVLAMVPPSKSFCIFYGRSIPRRGVDVDTDVTVFALINENADMVEIGKRIRREGVETATLRLAE